jgi:hypothetical protein
MVDRASRSRRDGRRHRRRASGRRNSPRRCQARLRDVARSAPAVADAFADSDRAHAVADAFADSDRAHSDSDAFADSDPAPARADALADARWQCSRSAEASGVALLNGDLG